MIVPEGIDDPLRPSGGNVYDRRLCDGLAENGWTVVVHEVAGRWPRPEPTSSAALADALERLPAGSLVVLDGLLASANPDVVVPAAARLRLVVLLHMPLPSIEIDAFADMAEREHAVLTTAAAVITTSDMTRSAVLADYALDPDVVTAAPPGVDPAEPATRSSGGSRLICVAAVTPAKGHDVLLAALDELRDLDWTCRCVGSLHLDLGFVDRLSEFAYRHSLTERLEFTGPLVGPDLADAFETADLLVLPSRAETYGMVLTEALARGIPVVAADVGGVSEAIGRAADGAVPGLLVRPDDSGALAASLRRWLVDAELRTSLRRAAMARRAGLTDWSNTVDQVAQVLTQVETPTYRGNRLNRSGPVPVVPSRAH